MSAAAAFNDGACRAVPIGTEKKCTQRGWGKPRLCDRHRQEYIQLTDNYHLHHKDAEGQYSKVLKFLDDAGYLKSLSNPAAVEKALKAVYSCLDAIDDVIEKREAHHSRFFGKADSSHRMCIDTLWKKRDEVEEIAKMLAA